jgi:hypothetical protein
VGLRPWVLPPGFDPSGYLATSIYQKLIKKFAFQQQVNNCP